MPTPGAMVRKPILMPIHLIAKVDQIAGARNVSFAEIIREAVMAFDGERSTRDDDLLESMAQLLIETTNETIKKIEALEKRLDQTHKKIAHRREAE